MTPILTGFWLQSTQSKCSGANHCSNLILLLYPFILNFRPARGEASVIENFFCYGPFAKGQSHYKKLINLIHSEKRAFARGKVYRLKCGMPAFIATSDGDLVDGQFLELKVSSSFWPIFDEIMGYDPQRPDKGLFQRSHVPLKVGDFSTQLAWTYTLNPKKITKTMPLVPQNDWQNYFKKNRTVLDLLDERHREYICRLARSRSREIVPIKMDLYRELINLELIVDKGRRLALTPMGKETALFLS